MTDDLLRKFAELNPVVEPDRLVAFDEPDLPADPVLRAVLEQPRTNGRELQATVTPDPRPPARRRTRTLVAVGAAAAVVTLVAITGLVVLNTHRPAPMLSQDALILYADGDIHCPDHVADLRSLPVGTIEYYPGEREVRVVVRLTNAAPDQEYEVSLWSDRGCFGEEDPYGWSTVGNGVQGVPMATDGDGTGVLDHVFTGIEPGTYRLNVNLVTELDEHNDFRHREMGAAEFKEVVVGGNGG